MNDQEKMDSRRCRRTVPAVLGFVAGLIVAAVAVYVMMPRMMIVTAKSRYGLDETVSRLQESIERNGWVVSGVSDMNASLAKHGHTFEPGVKVVRLCKAEYAVRVLQGDRHLSSIMPCAISVWEGDDGQVYLSKMNTGLMGRMFGGTVAEVMGSHVGPEEARILSEIVQR